MSGLLLSAFKNSFCEGAAAKIILTSSCFSNKVFRQFATSAAEHAPNSIGDFSRLMVRRSFFSTISFISPHPFNTKFTARKRKTPKNQTNSVMLRKCIEMHLVFHIAEFILTHISANYNFKIRIFVCKSDNFVVRYSRNCRIFSLIFSRNIHIQ